MYFKLQMIKLQILKLNLEVQFQPLKGAISKEQGILLWKWLQGRTYHDEMC